MKLMLTPSQKGTVYGIVSQSSSRYTDVRINSEHGLVSQHFRIPILKIPTELFANYEHNLDHCHFHPLSIIPTLMFCI
jgi:hypothetical protein